MSIKPNLNSVWQQQWGAIPSLDDLWEAPDDPSVAPGLWPRVPENSGFRVIPILNKGLWLTLVKLDRPDGLLENQKQALLSIGFREGSNGRIINPGYPTQGIINATNKIVGGTLDPLNPDDVVSLSPGDHFEPQIPLSVQAGIRWLWKTRPSVLLSEIVTSLSEQEDDLSETHQALLAGTTLADNGERLVTGPISNPVRLQMWVSRALSGEIDPVTEPILSLGLNSAMASYSVSPDEWPEDCQELYEQLREFRGEPVVDVSESNQTLFEPSEDLRPGLRTKVSWVIDNGRKSGVVVGLAEEDDEGLWVMPLDTQRPSDSAFPFYAPRRIRIPLSAVVDPVIQRPEPENLSNIFEQYEQTTPADAEGNELEALFDNPEADQESQGSRSEEDAPDSEGQGANEENAVNLKPQPALKLSDLPPALQYPSDAEDMDATLYRMVVSQARSLTFYGKHPLTAPTSIQVNEMIAGWREDISSFIWQAEDAQSTKRAATMLARDLMLDEFNAAQPETENDVRSPLAVLPMGTQITGNDPKGEVEAEINDLNLNWYRVGINPHLLPTIKDRLQEWESSEAPALADEYGKDIAHELKMSVDRLNGSSTTLNELTFEPASELFRHNLSAQYRKVEQETKSSLEIDKPTSDESVDIAVRVHKELATPERRAEVLKHGRHRLLFQTKEAAWKYMRGGSPEIRTATKNNERLLNSVAQLSGKPLSDVEKSRHPLFIITDVLNEAGLGARNRSEALAMLGIDLAHQAHLVGHIAQLSGISIDVSHNSYITEAPDESEADELVERMVIRNYEKQRGRQRAALSTGFIRQGDRLRPFQVGVLCTKESLFEEYEPRVKNTFLVAEDGDISTNPLGRYESLGRLVDLNAVHPVSLGEPLTQDNQVLTIEARDKLEPTWYGFGKMDLLQEESVANRSVLSAVEECTHISELPENVGKTSGQDIALTARERKEMLLTATPSWRFSADRREKVMEALKLFQQDFKPISAARGSSVQDKMMEALSKTPQAEIMVIAAKAAKYSFRYRIDVVTRDDLQKVGMDRDLAIEYAVMDMKSDSMALRKGYQFASFDVTQTLRPESIRYLNDLQEDARLQRILEQEEERGEEPKTTKTRGKRQDKGLVAGLAAKDLRGKVTTVLSTLDNASRSDQAKFITKTRLWEAPDWVFLRAPSDDDILKGAAAMEPVVAAFFDEMRTRLATKPPANIPAITRQYAKFILGVRDAFDRIRTEEELLDALNPESGEIAELKEGVEDTLRKLDYRPGLVMGEDAWDSSYRYINAKKDDPVFRHVLEKARRRTLQNTLWDIKETSKKGRRPNQDDKPKTGAMPMLSKLVRKGGKDHRGGLDISEDLVINTFGFSGIEYGNSMTQNDRTTYLNEAYDGFMDMAELLEVPPKALSLGGTLGLAFGSRGRGGRNAALAHFEPLNNAINLTRMRGAGSMAHEYGHAFANYLYRLSRGVPGSRTEGDITTSINKQVKPGGTEEILGGNLRAPVAEAVAEVLRTMRYRPVDDEHPHSGRTFFDDGGRNADDMDGRKKPYWATAEEMFARAFETYVHAGLSEKHPGFRNDFLVRPDKLTAWGGNVYSAKKALETFERRERAGLAKRESLPSDATEEEKSEFKQRNLERLILARRIRMSPVLYPAGDELDRVKAAFKALFDTLETKDQSVRHDHLGEVDLPILYSHNTGSIARVSEKEHQILAHCVMQEVARMCGPGVWVSWHKELQDEEGNAAAGRYREYQTAQEKVRSVIDLAYGAPMSTAHHEAFHFAQRHLLTDNETQMMDRHFSPGSELSLRLVESLKAEGKHDLIEVVARDTKEAQAYAYEQWVRGKLDIKVTEQPATVFGRVSNFFGRVLGLAKHSGFNAPEQLFQAFYQGGLVSRKQASRLREAMKVLPEATRRGQAKESIVVEGDESRYAKPVHSESTPSSHSEHPKAPAIDSLEDDGIDESQEDDLFFRQGC